MSSTMTDDHSEVAGVTDREIQQMSDNKRSDMMRLKFDRSSVWQSSDNHITTLQYLCGFH